MTKKLKRENKKTKMSFDKVKGKRGSDCEQYPAFSFRYLTKKKDFNFDFFSNNTGEGNRMFESLSNKLKNISEKPYTYWNGLSKNQGGIETINFWQCKLQPNGLKLSPDDKIIVFRFFHQKYRILGIRLDKCPTLYIIGLDFNHSAYNHGN